MYILNSLWQIEICKLDFVKRWFWYPEIGYFLLKSIHWVNSSARSSFFEKHIILTKLFQPTRAASAVHSLKNISLCRTFYSVNGLYHNFYFLFSICKWKEFKLFQLLTICDISLKNASWYPKNISYHNFYLFFAICKWKVFKLFQLLTIFDISLKNVRLGG